jgi:NAD(P)-dependent dehydrogenase (short-subunit alcohol dehydrogenase family)
VGWQNGRAGECWAMSATRAAVEDMSQELGPSGFASTGRFTTPREVATIVALLASPRMANVTGANWVIDGALVKTV